jgi:hypothetical protein
MQGSFQELELILASEGRGQGKAENGPVQSLAGHGKEFGFDVCGGLRPGE